MSRKKKPLPLLRNIVIESVAAEGNCLFHVTAVPQPDGTVRYEQPQSSEGKRPEGSFVVFVPFCVPGDVVDVQLRRKKHSYAEGEVVRLITPAPQRITPQCEHFGICGGCKWQTLPYPEQLAFKQQQVYDQLTRIGKIELPPFCDSDNPNGGFRPIKGSANVWEYRNKLDFGCSNKQWLTHEDMQSGVPFAPAIGFHITGAFDKILPIRKCWLMADLHNDIRNSIYRYAIDNGLSFFDLRQQTGLLRDIIIRCSNTGEWMVIIQVHIEHLPFLLHDVTQASQSAERNIEHYEEREKESVNRQWSMVNGLLQHIADKFPQITSLLYLDNQKCNDTIGDQEILVFKGNDHIFLEMEGLRFKVGPKSFYQTNTEQAYELYKVVRDFAFAPIENGVWKNEDYEMSQVNGQWSMVNGQWSMVNGQWSMVNPPLVYDLYTGTGTIANFVARFSRQVVGIEYVPEAIEDAKINSQLNGISNTLFYAGDMKDILTDDFIRQHGHPDVIITDPPRAGMHPDVIQVILNAHPQRIVYVSCNPATQARDLALLDASYKVVTIQPVDMFPHTPHVENVVLLERK